MSTTGAIGRAWAVPLARGSRLLRLLAVFAAAVAGLGATATCAFAAPPANDDFANATVIPGGAASYTDSGNLAQATRESGEPEHTGYGFGGGHTVWYAWTPTANATVSFDVCGSTTNVATAVYTGSSVTSLGSRVGTTSICGFSLRTDVTVTAGTTYHIALEDVNFGTSNPGAYTLNLTRPGSISGTVTGQGPTPLANVCVQAVNPQTGNTVGSSVNTDSAGKYTLPVSAGNYAVKFGCSGGSYAPEYYNDSPTLANATPVAVTSGEAVQGIDAELGAAASISGTVVDKQGAPVSGTCVLLHFSNDSSTWQNFALTDSSGNYSFSGLAATSYKVGFAPGCFGSSPLKDEFYDNKLTFADADSITLTAGQSRTGVDAVLTTGASIAGTVRDGSGNPIEWVCVNATPTSGSGGSSANFYTGADGRYTITGLNPGSYRIRFQDCLDSGYVDEYYDDAKDISDADPVTVTRDQERTGFDAALDETGELGGTVTGPAGEALEDVCVEIYDASGDSVDSTYTDASGHYNFTALDPGGYRVEFSPCGSGNLLREFYNDKSTLAAATVVQVGSGQTLTTIDAQLVAGGTIAGTVTGPGNAPVEDACVTAYDSTDDDVAYDYTAADGTYSLDGLSTGDYKIQFEDCDTGALLSEYYNDKRSYSAADAVHAVTGSTISGINAQLARGGTLSGTVTDSSNQPVDACVYLYDANGDYADDAYTAANGNYTFSGLTTGDYKVEFQDCDDGSLLDEWYDDKKSEAAADLVHVTEGQDTTGISASLQSGGVISGTVTGPADQPLSNACVNLRDSSGSLIDSRSTNSSGGYTFNGLETGNYKVGFQSCGAGSFVSEYYNDKPTLSQADSIPVTAGQTSGGIDAKLSVGGTITGTVTGPSGSPLANICVYVASGPSSASSLTNASGNYSLPQLATGTYKVYFYDCFSSAYHGEYFNDKPTLGQATPINVIDGSTTSGINAQLAAAGRITGTVTNSSGQPQEDICVNAYDSNDNYAGSGYTDSSGQYTISGLASGSYRVAFRPCDDQNLLPEFYNDKATLDTATPVTVTAGGTTANINAQLATGASVSGTVTGPGGQPLEDVCVYADYGDDSGYANTDASGHYTVTGLPTGSAIVSFRSCGSGNFIREYYDDKSSYELANPVPTTAGQTTSGINAQLAAGGSVKGTVTSPGGAPLSDICVEVYDSDEDYVGDDETANNGTYTVDGLATGSYRVEFYNCGNSGSYAGEYYVDAADFDSATPVPVMAGQETNGINAQLDAGAVIAGHVTEPGGADAEYVCVDASYADGDYARDDETDSDGNYRIANLRAGTYVIRFEDCSGDDLATEFYDNSPTRSGATQITLTTGQNRSGVDAQLGSAGTISGTVTDGTNPLTYACVAAYSPSDSSSAIGYGDTDGSGHYTVGGLPAGSYKVAFDEDCDDTIDQWYNDKTTFAAADSVTVTAGADTPNINAALTSAQPPTVDITGGPSGATTLVQPTFTFSTSGSGTVECSIDTGTPNYGSCSGASSHTPASPLTDGSYTFRVRITGGSGSDTETRSFTVDTHAPSLQITSGPNGATSEKRPTFGFSAEAGSTLACSIDTGTPSFGACSTTSSHTPSSDLSDGPYTFRVRATDAAGNIDTKTQTFSVDTLGPSVNVTGGPSGPTNNATPTFTFSSAAGSTVQCSISSGAASFGPCTTGTTFTPSSPLSDGSYTFTVRATDGASNSNTAARSFSVDTAAPNTSITTGPAEGSTISNASPSFTFTSTESGSTFECKVDSGSYSSCSPPKTIGPLSDGQHTFSVRAIDGANNADATPETRTFTVAAPDTTPPDTSITSGPSGTINTASATFAFTATESGSTFECKLDGGSFSSCTSPRTLTGLADGSHTFQVRATDSAGNVDASPASQTFTVSTATTPPPPDTSACDAAKAKQAQAAAAVTKAKVKVKKAKSKNAKKKAKAKLKKAKSALKDADAAVAAAC